MKRLLFLPFFSLLFIQCDKNCAEKPSTCEEQPASSGITCQAYWESWVYDEATNNCEYVGYSGCGPIGFETEKECEACECND